MSSHQLWQEHFLGDLSASSGADLPHGYHGRPRHCPQCSIWVKDTAKAKPGQGQRWVALIIIFEHFKELTFPNILSGWSECFQWCRPASWVPWKTQAMSSPSRMRQRPQQKPRSKVTRLLSIIEHFTKRYQSSKIDI